MVDDAQFIAELDVNVPAGTDLIADGDNEIRAVKIATQQTFPNADAAVNLTAAQLNAAAIKTEDNTFQGQTIGLQRFQANNVNFVNSHSGDRGYAYENDANGETEWILQARGTSKNWRLQRFVAGVSTDSPISVEFLNGRVTLTEQLTVGGAIRNSAGSAGLPSYAFSDDPDTGMYRSSSNVLNFATSGADRIALTASEMNIKSSQIWAVIGTAAKPAYSFSTEQNTGMFLFNTAVLDFSVFGNTRFRVTNQDVSILQVSSTGGGILNFKNAAGITAWSISYEGTSGFQPRQLTVSRFNATTGAFIDNPFYIAIDGRVHSLLPVLTP